MDIWTIGGIGLVAVLMYFAWKNGDSSSDGGDIDFSDNDGGSDGGGD